MANDITGNISITSTKSSSSPSVGLTAGGWQIDQGAAGLVDTIRALTTVSEQINLGDITEIGMVAVQNFDATVNEDVLMSWDDSNFEIRCPAEGAILVGAPSGTSACYVKAASGTPSARIFILQA